MRCLLVGLLLLLPLTVGANDSYRPVVPKMVALRRSVLFDVGSSIKGGGGGASPTLSSVWQASQTFNDDVELIFGTGSDASIAYNTAQTPDALFIGVGQDSRCLIIGEKSDKAFDFAHAQNTNPCVWIHSPNQNTAQWMKFEHDGASGQIRIGTGALAVIAPTTTYMTIPGTTMAVISSITNSAIAIDGTGTGGGSSIQFGINGVRKVSFGYLDETSSIGAKGFFMYNQGLADYQLILEEATRNVIVGSCIVCAAPVGGTIKSAGASAADTAGSSLTIAGGLGRGTAAGGNVIVQATTPTTSGSTAQTYITRWVVVAKPRTLTTDTATTVFTVSGLGAHKRTGGTLEFSVEASDGTNDQVASCLAFWSAVDTTAGAGGETCGLFLTGTCSALLSGAASSGTLGVTAAVTTGTDTCNYQLTATSSLTETTLQATYSVSQNGTVGTVNPQ